MSTEEEERVLNTVRRALPEDFTEHSELTINGLQIPFAAMSPKYGTVIVLFPKIYRI